MAFRNVRNDLMKTIGSQFEIVWVESHRSARLVHSDSQLTEAVRVNTAVLVIAPDDELARLAKVWAAELEDRLHNTAAVKRARRKSTSQAV
jgi:DNA-directed RNA polymerase subunit K/omega